MSKRRKDPADLSANLTSLIDVTFLLIVFFVLVSKINEVERWQLELPSVRSPLSEKGESEHRVVINVIPAPAGRVSSYRVGLAEFAGDDAGLSSMTDHLAGLYQTSPSIDVNVRADRATHYEFVEPVLQAVSNAAHKSGAAGVNPRVNLVVTRGS